MEDFWGSVKIMLAVYAMAAVISFALAWIIKLIFFGIRRRAGASPPSSPGEATGAGGAAARKDT